MNKKHARKSNATDQKYTSDETSVSSNSDTSPYVFQRDKIAYNLKIRELPWTEKQKAIIDLFNDKHTKAIFLRGGAGTSKTATAIYCGLQALNNHKVSDMVLIRSAIESSDAHIGFLPGSALDKISPFMAPFTEKLSEFLPAPQILKLQDDNRIQMIPVGHTRGLHFSVKFVCCDEAQCLTKKEILTVLSRVGNFCKVFILGDPQQSDLPYGKTCFNQVFDAFNTEEAQNQGIYCIDFTEEDCMRSEFCKYITKTFESLKS